MPTPSAPGYLVELRDTAVSARVDQRLEAHLGPAARVRPLGFVQAVSQLMVVAAKQVRESIPVVEMATAWRGTLDW